MNIAVYCSAKETIPQDYLALGKELGRWLAEQGHTLVYGGATGGLMTRVSNAAKASGGYVIGVVPHRIVASYRKAENCDELYEVEDMCERKRLMRDKANCFVCLPGSYGTLDEMFDVISSGTVGEHHKPLFVVNYKGFYDALLAEAEHMRTLRFLPQEENYKPHYVNTLEELYEELNHIGTTINKV